MIRITATSIVLLLILTIAGCKKTKFSENGDFFYLSNDGAKLPVWVTGNFESDVILITVHGGPGDGGMDFTISDGFQALENDYMVVYWDQRFAGLFQGQPDKITMNVDQYIEDTEKIVQLVQSKYPGKKLFMLGHSWGGQLSAGYLGRDNHQDNFKGWIDLDGSIYGDLEVQLMKDWILERVPAKLQEPDADVDYWQYIIDWYEEHPVSELGNYSDPEPYWYAGALDGDVYDEEAYWNEFKPPYDELLFNSMFSMSFYVDAHGGEQAWSDAANFTDELGNITIPVLLLWGNHDGIVPTGVADYVYDHLATNAIDKSIVKIPECAHVPQIEKPEIFYQEVRSFIENYK